MEKPSAKIIRLDDRVPKLFESMRCLFCGTIHSMIIPKIALTQKNRYFACPGCDEEASVPERTHPVLIQL